MIDINSRIFVRGHFLQVVLVIFKINVNIFLPSVEEVTSTSSPEKGRTRKTVDAECRDTPNMPQALVLGEGLRNFGASAKSCKLLFLRMRQ